VAVWLWFWIREDRKNPEPKRLIWEVFLGGALAVVAAYFLSREVCTLPWLSTTCMELKSIDWANRSLLSLIFDLRTAGLLKFKIIFLIWAMIEETLKFLAVYLIAFRRPEFDEPIDAMIYMLTAALGFAALENSLFLFNSVFDAKSSAVFLLTGNMRFLGANLVHVVSSALVGGFVALAFCFNKWRRRTYLYFGLIIASVLHAIFNLLIMFRGDENMFLIFLLLWLCAIFVIWLFERVKTIICLKTSDLS